MVGDTGLEAAKSPSEDSDDLNEKRTFHRQNKTEEEQPRNTKGDAACCTFVLPGADRAAPLSPEEIEWVQLLRGMSPADRAAALAAARALAHFSAPRGDRPG